MTAAAAVTGSLLLTVGCSSSNSGSGSTSGNTGSGANWATASSISAGVGVMNRIPGELRAGDQVTALAPGASVQVSLPAQPVLVAPRRVS